MVLEFFKIDMMIFKFECFKNSVHMICKGFSCKISNLRNSILYWIGTIKIWPKFDARSHGIVAGEHKQPKLCTEVEKGRTAVALPHLIT